MDILHNLETFWSQSVAVALSGRVILATAVL